MMSVHASTFLPVRLNFTEARCPSCNKLCFRWRADSRRATVDVKCSRCGHLSLLAIGTTAA